MRCTLAILPVLVAMFCVQVDASIIVNGDFSNAEPLFGFLPTGNTVSEPTDEFAQLENDGTQVRTLAQTFIVPLERTVLSFDFAFSTDLTESESSYFDSFAASKITTIDGDFLDILVVDFFGGVIPDPSDGIESITGAIPIDVNFDDSVAIPGFSPFVGGTTFAGRVSLQLPAAVLGEEVTLSFELLEADNATTRAAVDNIQTRPAVVPEPGSMFAWALLLAMASFSYLRFMGLPTRKKSPRFDTAF